MSAKELGMIHNVRLGFTLDHNDSATYNHDLAGQLTEQLQQMVRQGQYFKVVGIDVGLSPVTGNSAVSGTVTGNFKYYAPTRGRCAAYRAAFKAMAEAMKVQGITMRNNKFYDFRVPYRDTSNYANAVPFANGASFDGVTELAMNGSAPNGVFQVHNSGVEPQTAGGDVDFSEGFGVFGNAGNDFVLNENQQGYLGNSMIAETEFEEIPFQVKLDMSTNQDLGGTLTWQWRPDPALYLAVLAGQFEVEITETKIAGAGSDSLQFSVAYSVAGWKSIMGNPDKKRRRSRRSNGNGKSHSKSSTTTTVTTVKK